MSMQKSLFPPSLTRLILWPYWPALALGVLMATWVVPWSLIVGHGGFELVQQGDMAQHLAGQRYFIADAWRWPILDYRNANIPYGASVVMSDSVPVLALLLKALGIGPRALNGMYLWAWLTYVLLAASAAYAFHAAGGRGRWAALCCAAVCLSTPSFLARFNFGHIALTSHFVLLLALAFYFQAIQRSARTMLVRYCALFLLSLLLHPYLFLMVAALAAAAVLTSLRERPQTSLAIVMSGVAALVLAWVFGYFGTYQAGGEFGHFSMNLQSPFFPSGSAVFPSFGWSTPDATGGQYEGFNYLGAGVLLLLVVTLLRLLCSADKLELERHWGLVVACLGLLLLAVSTTGYWGQHKIWEIDRYPEILAQFRSSGRFFWPVTYVLVVACAAYLSRCGVLGVWVALLLGAAAGAQCYDQKYNWEGNWKMFHEQPRAVVDVALLSDTFSKAKSVNFFPQFGCGLSPDNAVAMQALLVASRYEVPINTMHLARQMQQFQCSQQLTAPLASGEVRVVFAGAEVEEVPDYASLCVDKEGYSVCHSPQL